MEKKILKAIEEAYRKGLKDAKGLNDIGPYLLTSQVVAQDLAKDSIRSLELIIDSLEKLRRSNEALREWGNDLVSRCKELEEEVLELESKVSDLEDEHWELINQEGGEG